MPVDKRVKRIVEFAFLMAIALVLSYLESLIDLSSILPGVKIGISNVVLTFVLYQYGDFATLGFGLSKLFLSMFFLGRLSTLFYSLTGMVFAVIAMIIIHRLPVFSPLGVNVGGAVMHVVGQMCAAVYVLGNVSVLRFVPFLIITGVLSGVFTYIPLRALWKINTHVHQKF